MKKVCIASFNQVCFKLKKETITNANANMFVWTVTTEMAIFLQEQ